MKPLAKPATRRPFCRVAAVMRRLLPLIVAAGLGPATVVAGDDRVAAGRAAYQQTCVACHGANGQGALPGIASFGSADGPLAQSDDALVRSILDGKQSPGSALAMPPKGGNPNLTETDARALVAFLRAEFGR